LTKDGIENIKSLIEDYIVIDNLSDEIKSFAAKLRKEKIVKKKPDAIIAANAKYYSQSLITFDKDFENIPSMDIVLFKNNKFKLQMQLLRRNEK
jgi:predicted nucleic acid-binding protein